MPGDAPPGWMLGDAPPAPSDPGMRNCAAAGTAVAAMRISTTRRMSTPKPGFILVLGAVRARNAGPDRRHAGTGVTDPEIERPVLGGRLVDQRIARNAPPQRLERTRPDPREPAELELHEEQARLLGGGGLELLRDRADDPAAGIIFEPDQRLDRLVPHDVVAVTANAVEAGAERPLHCGID